MQALSAEVGRFGGVFRGCAGFLLVTGQSLAGCVLPGPGPRSGRPSEGAACAAPRLGHCSVGHGICTEQGLYLQCLR